MVGILREADLEPVASVTKKHGFSEQTIYTLHQRFSSMNAEEVKRLRQLEQEHSRLKSSWPSVSLSLKEARRSPQIFGAYTRQTPAGAFAFRRGRSRPRRVRYSPWPVQRSVTCRAGCFGMRLLLLWLCRLRPITVTAIVELRCSWSARTTQ